MVLRDSALDFHSVQLLWRESLENEVIESQTALCGLHMDYF
jgi:hypothetical protein